MFIRKEPKFFTLFNRQADNMYTAARYFNELVTTGKFNEETVAQMHRIEHEGDIVCREVSDMLNRTFITPLPGRTFLSSPTTSTTWWTPSIQ
jgi:uncharacterized protein Yka (UPF0111/DUF47 family)